MVSEVQVEIDKHLGVSFLPHYLSSLLMVSEVQVEIDKHQGVSFLPHYLCSLLMVSEGQVEIDKRLIIFSPLPVKPPECVRGSGRNR